jgi:acylphosphatase
VVIYVEWEENGSTKRVRGEDLLYNVRTEKSMKHAAWVFSGSRMVPDLNSEDPDARLPQAFMGNDIVALNHLDASALFQNPHPEAAKENTYKKNEETLPPLGTPVKLTIEVNAKMQRYILIGGKVQGVGFRAFTQRNARQLGLHGYAKNLPNGKVEVVAEGDKAALDALVKAVRKGPPASRVDDVKIEERPYRGTYKAFEIRY